MSPSSTALVIPSIIPVAVPVAAVVTLANSGTQDTFIAKYNSAGRLLWAARQASPGSDTVNGITIDSSGNVFIAGDYGSDPHTLYNSDGSTATTLANSGGKDGFVAKYNSAGVVQWAARQAGTLADYAMSPAVDSSGNVFVAGYFSSNPFTLYNVDGSAFATTLATSGLEDSFVAKYNSAGVVQWAARQGGASSDLPRSAAVDSSGNVIIAGNYNANPLTLYNANGSAFATTLINSGGMDGFIAKYNSAGVVQWAARQASTGTDSVNGISIDSSGNLFITGHYSATLTLYNSDASPFATTLDPGGAQESFIAKYNSAGVVQWAARQGGTGTDNGYGIAVDLSGNVFITGLYTSDPLTLYNSDGSPFATTLIRAGGQDAFIAKYNSAGVVQWAARVGGLVNERGNGIAVDLSGNVFITGFYTSNLLTLYNSDGSPFATTLANSGGLDAFIAKYNSAGVVQWVAQQAGALTDVNMAVAVDSSGNVIVGGYYSSSPLTLYSA
jgi:hypothetical protein